MIQDGQINKSCQQNEFIVVLTTCNDKVLAHEIANQLVGQKLAACVKLVPNISSTYFWDDQVVTDEEHQLLIKTTRHLYNEVELLIKSLHTYEVPELIAIPAIAGSKEYLDWIASSVRNTQLK